MLLFFILIVKIVPMAFFVVNKSRVLGSGVLEARVQKDLNRYEFKGLLMEPKNS